MGLLRACQKAVGPELAKGGFFLLEYLTFVILAKARIQILSQVFDRESQRDSAQTESAENDMRGSWRRIVRAKSRTIKVCQ
ncbi:hypothetical protein A3F45_01845 [Candidatus Curtissbacteria bacterium RIFCSPHIGHO2_12_FULL_41_17]|uniref:Uncharacterized protein n=1 Tax=Candidatus Curtissbacteria bacterium RIFCSPHIGHO2_12_FULL_41_17 TaxID=1797722 RepID=A0A1F5HM11_9BACT|nr:MAG: hypothetical protein A3F45_01845 [Candidatus Curtissbacteria bacterium RIFCSPHIGHO2_12_FULL_41_17]